MIAFAAVVGGGFNAFDVAFSGDPDADLTDAFWNGAVATVIGTSVGLVAGGPGLIAGALAGGTSASLTEALNQRSGLSCGGPGEVGAALGRGALAGGVTGFLGSALGETTNNEGTAAAANALAGLGGRAFLSGLK